MKFIVAVLFGTLTVASFAQTVKAKLPPAQPSVQQTSTGNNSPNINGPVNPQAPAAAEPTVAELKRELAVQKVRTAIAQAQAAEANVSATTQIAQQQAAKMDKVAQDLIISTQRDLGYDDRWEWNMQAMNYVQKPQVGQPQQPKK